MKPAVLNMREHNDIRSAVQDSIPHLQRADANFAKNSGCISCHNNSLTQMTMGIARRRGFAIDEKVDAIETHINAEVLLKSADLLHQGFLVAVEDNFSEGVLAYVLFGLEEEGYKPDLGTDAAVMHILWRQQPNGQWYSSPADGRQPLCELWVGQTAESMRALQLYMPKTDQAAYRAAIRKASSWMATAKSYNNDDRSWRVAGLAWAGDQKVALAEAVSELKAAQKPDGSWSDLPTMEGTAYATGRSLVALHIAGMPSQNPVYQRGVKWLLTNQQTDGTWFVRTRALAFQPSFDAGFPGGHSQFISAAGTNWADQALLYALPEAKDVKASR
jgi:squalene cyclase